MTSERPKTSRVPGFHHLSLTERRAFLAERLGTEMGEMDSILDGGGLDSERANLLVENVLGTYSLPLALALNFVIDGQERLVPMVVEEPSVVAAASNAAKMVRAGGGFISVPSEALMIGQIELRQVPDETHAAEALALHETELLARAERAVPGLVARGGGPKRLVLRKIGEGHLVLHLLVDCQDAMGANLVNTAVETIAPFVAELCGGKVGLKILSNLADQRLTEVHCEVPGDALVQGTDWDAGRVMDDIEAASTFAARDPYRAATHNKGIMNGVDSVVMACGNDYRSVEAGAHAYAARSGGYAPLSTWQRQGGVLAGRLTLPLALGVVGGTLRTHRGAQLALRVAVIAGAQDLARVAASAGLASNLAALRALATEGIQRGHMSLHARSVAVAAGATGPDVELVAEQIAREGNVTLARASVVLAEHGRPRRL